MSVRRLAILLLLSIATATGLYAQAGTRRLTTVAALRQYPAYYHLQTVLLRGELAEDGRRVLFRADDRELQAFLKDTPARSGAVEVRAQVVDVGRLDPADPRVQDFALVRDATGWPRPGEELILNVTGVAEAQTALSPSVRALSLEPWKWEGQTVTVTGNFRGRNLFGDLPDAPGKGRYDFVLRGAEGALWVTDQRPRGRGFDLDVDRRIDSDKWLEVTGTVSRVRGLVTLAATRLALAKAETTAPAEAEAPPPPPQPLTVVFNTPSDGEIDVSRTAPVRVQFSRGLRESTLADRVRVSYVGAAASAMPVFKVAYDAANRAVTVSFAEPLEALRTVRVELVDGVLAFDGGPLAPWSATFTVGN